MRRALNIAILIAVGIIVITAICTACARRDDYKGVYLGVEYIMNR